MCSLHLETKGLDRNVNY